MFSQVVVGTSRLDTIKQIGHGPTGVLQWWQWKRRVKEGTPHSGSIDSSEHARVRRGFNHRNPSATGENVCPVSDAVIKISSS
jgi:hypothetical protein